MRYVVHKISDGFKINHCYRQNRTDLFQANNILVVKRDHIRGESGLSTSDPFFVGSLNTDGSDDDHESYFDLKLCVPSFEDCLNFIHHGKVNMHHDAVICTGRINAFNFLLERGSDPTLKNNNGLTVLHRTAEGGNDELIEKLLSLGLDIDSRISAGTTPLMVATVNGRLIAFNLM